MENGFRDFRISRRHNVSKPGDLPTFVYSFHDSSNPGGLLRSVFDLLKEAQQIGGISGK
jgi:hypothetical protein